jgi:hypothetical protein
MRAESGVSQFPLSSQTTVVKRLIVGVLVKKEEEEEEEEKVGVSSGRISCFWNYKPTRVVSSSPRISSLETTRS